MFGEQRQEHSFTGGGQDCSMQKALGRKLGVPCARAAHWLSSNSLSLVGLLPAVAARGRNSFILLLGGKVAKIVKSAGIFLFLLVGYAIDQEWCA